MNNITGESQEDSPPNFRGGILADAMGLGKTLTTIALIASTLKEYRDARPDNARFARHLRRHPNVKKTLIIVPLSHELTIPIVSES